MTTAGVPSPFGSAEHAKWEFSIVPFIPAFSGTTECEVLADFNFLGAVVKGGFNFCPFASWTKDFLYWVIGMFTALSLWNVVYSANAGRV
jgi:hypothetical protein